MYIGLNNCEFKGFVANQGSLHEEATLNPVLKAVE